MNGDLLFCPQCKARIEPRIIRIGSFYCPSCDEYLSFSQEWWHRLTWAALGLAFVIVLIFDPHPRWLADFLLVALALLIATAVYVALIMFHHPPKLERGLRPGSGSLGLHE